MTRQSTNHCESAVDHVLDQVGRSFIGAVKIDPTFREPVAQISPEPADEGKRIRASAWPKRRDGAFDAVTRHKAWYRRESPDEQMLGLVDDLRKGDDYYDCHISMQTYFIIGMRIDLFIRFEDLASGVAALNRANGTRYELPHFWKKTTGIEASRGICGRLSPGRHLDRAQ